MHFSVIYTVDVPEDVDIVEYSPPGGDELWEQTEGDEEYEYTHLGGCWAHGHHRKFAALLNRLQFDEFVAHCGLIASDVETLGSIGAPGCGYGWSPAICFDGEDPMTIRDAYVTPLPEITRESCNERDWARIRKAMLSVYGRRPAARTR